MNEQMKTKKKPYPGTQAILRAITLLKTFSEAQPTRSLVELSEVAGLNRTTTYRLLSVLESEGLVAYNPTTDTYRLGSEMIVFGARALRANPLREVVRPTLVTLAQKTGEMASLEILEERQTLILDEVKGENQRRLSTSVGNLWPAHATSTGKVLLAHLPMEAQTALLAKPLTRLTTQTLTDGVILQTKLAQIREQGYAIAVNELEVGLTEVAAPLYNHRQEAIAAISVGGPTIRLPASKIPDLVRLVIETAAMISSQLGYRADAD